MLASLPLDVFCVLLITYVHDVCDVRSLGLVSRGLHALVSGVSVRTRASKLVALKGAAAALEFALDISDAELMVELFAQHGLDVNTRLRGNTPLLHHVASMGDLKMLRALLAMPNLDVNVLFRRGDVPPWDRDYRAQSVIHLELPRDAFCLLLKHEALDVNTDDE